MRSSAPNRPGIDPVAITETTGMMKARKSQEHVVRKIKFTEDQIAFALKQNELGTSVDEVCRKSQRGDVLRLEIEVQRHRAVRVATTAPARGRKQEAEVDRGRPEPGQGDAAGRRRKKSLRPSHRREREASTRRAAPLAVQKGRESCDGAAHTLRCTCERPLCLRASPAGPRVGIAPLPTLPPAVQRLHRAAPRPRRCPAILA